LKLLNNIACLLLIAAGIVLGLLLMTAVGGLFNTIRMGGF